jgi:hypothetical protein
MLKFLSRVLLALTFLVSTAAAQSLTTTAHVKLRNRPTSHARVISLLDIGAKLETLSADSLKNGYAWVSDGPDSGWVFKRYTKKVRPAATMANPMNAIASVTSLATCPLEGRGKTGKAPSSSDIASNRRKRHVLPLGPSTSLTFADFSRLQKDVENIFHINSHLQTLTLEESDRSRLQSLPLESGEVSEGDLVQIVGYIAPPDPHANSGETVNCYLSGHENNDFHITIADRTTTNSGYKGIVVEMIPQDRPAEWTLPNLLRVEADKRPVLVVGQLFYDMKHKVNDDPAHKKQGQPPRSSLFEIHPISEIYVCSPGQTCTADSSSNWVKLKDY